MIKYLVDGLYSVGQNVSERQEREYSANSDDEVIDMAKSDGLVKAMFIEIPFGDFQPCTLGLKNIANLNNITSEVIVTVN